MQGRRRERPAGRPARVHVDVDVERASLVSFILPRMRVRRPSSFPAGYQPTYGLNLDAHVYMLLLITD